VRSSERTHVEAGYEDATMLNGVRPRNITSVKVLIVIAECSLSYGVEAVKELYGTSPK
jgi:hypothetical protein